MSLDAELEADAVITAYAFDKLPPDVLADWCRLRATSPLYDSPYFDPRFAAAVHSVHGDVTVLAGADVVFAVQCSARTARPVGWPGADFQGPMVGPGAFFDPRAALSALGVRALAFDHLVDPGLHFTQYVDGFRRSPYVEVDGGLDGYLARASKSGRANLAQARRRARKLSNEYGELRFEPNSTDRDVLLQVIEMKRAQYRASGARDHFTAPGRRELLEVLLGVRDPDFSGVLSGVFVGDRIVAGHFGIRSASVLHWWFPVYDPEFRAYAPGWILMHELIANAVATGVSRIDLGRGDDEYKRRVMTGYVDVAYGLVAGPGLRGIHKMQASARSALEFSPLGPFARAAVRRHRSRTTRSGRRTERSAKWPSSRS
ncbi:GNAT family N-acetyltransferase [Rhodococcus sp. NPDC003383]